MSCVVESWSNNISVTTTPTPKPVFLKAVSKNYCSRRNTLISMRLEIQANPADEVRRPTNKAAGAEVANAVMKFLLPKMGMCIPWPFRSINYRVIDTVSVRP